jgi:Asp-tRNA(Asn)/Glu-tRNA(Gln) amidotransferase A subunit family amidase
MRRRLRNRRDFLAQAAALAVTLGASGFHGPAVAMMPRDLGNMGAVQALRALRRGDVSAEQYAGFCLERAKALEELGAFIALEPQRVLEAARVADRLRAEGKPLGPLHGLPIAVTDNIDAVGYATTAATPALHDNRPSSTAPVLARLLEAGAILLGKTNMHELAFGYTTNNPAYGTARNPYDRSRNPGGSSGGTAVAVAARIAPAGLGIDTVGSVRVPAALCGIAGFRPSTGRYPSEGIVPLSHTRDTAGSMARSVADLILLDAIMAGDDSPVEKISLKGLRLGLTRAYYWADLDAEVERIAVAVVAKLREAGAEIVEVDLAPLPAEAFEMHRCRAIQFHEARLDIARYLARTGTAVDFEAVASGIATPGVKSTIERFVLGPQSPSRENYDAAMGEYRPGLQEAYREAFERRLDAMVFPMTQVAAQEVGNEAEFEANGRRFPMLYLGRNADPGSCAGLPGVSLPAGRTTGGLPVGIGLDGPAGADRRLLAIAAAVEAALGHIPAPPV